MAVDVHDVEMLDDETLTVNGETYDLSAGDVVTVSSDYARKLVNRVNIATYHGDRYEVVDDEYDDALGPVDGSGSDDSDSADAENEADSGEDDEGTCDAELASGETCGRSLPCPYHS